MHRNTRYKLSAGAIMLLPLLLASACGPTGVLSVDMELNPVAVTEVPTELAEVPFGAIATASGTVVADVLEDSGMVTVNGLPSLPTGFRYIVEMSFAAEDREGLAGAPAAHDEGEGDADHDEADTEEEGHEPPTAVEFRLRDQDGALMVSFTSADIEGAPMGGLRSATVMIQALDESIHVPVLQGEAGAAGIASEGGGHSHGV